MCESTAQRAVEWCKTAVAISGGSTDSTHVSDYIQCLHDKKTDLNGMVAQNAGGRTIDQCTEDYSDEKGIDIDKPNKSPNKCFIETEEDTNYTNVTQYSSESFGTVGEKYSSDKALTSFEESEVSLNSSAICCTNEVTIDYDQTLITDNKFNLAGCVSLPYEIIPVNEYHDHSSFRDVSTVSASLNYESAVCQETFHPIFVKPALTMFVQGHSKCPLHFNMMWL